MAVPTFPFQHVVVLMLENVSYDRLFGNPEPSNQGKDIVRWDTPHDHLQVKKQLLAQNKEDWKAVYHNHIQDLIRSRKCPSENLSLDELPEIGRVMRQNTVLHSLQQEFVSSKQWFSSFPGPTMTNRFFAHCGGADTLNESEHPFSDRTTIYNLLDEQKISWGIYFHDIPHTALFKKLALTTHGGFKEFDQFKADVERKQLPEYVFIEPRYRDKSTTAEPEDRANDQHPPHNFKLGELLIKQIYDTLKSSEYYWQNTLYIVTYDEHGGYFDSEPPPFRQRPDTRNFLDPLLPVKGRDKIDESFERLGFRVPILFVSPWLEKGGTIDSEGVYFDHCSLLATIKAWKGLANTHLTWREAQAPTFHDRLPIRSEIRSRAEVPDMKLAWNLGDLRAEFEPDPYYSFHERMGLWIAKHLFVFWTRKIRPLQGLLNSIAPSISKLRTELGFLTYFGLFNNEDFIEGLRSQFDPMRTRWDTLSATVAAQQPLRIGDVDDATIVRFSTKEQQKLIEDLRKDLMEFVLNKEGNDADV